MQPVIQHPWDVTPDDALEIQKHLAARVVKEDRLGPVARIAGIDVAYHKDNDTLIATVAVLDAMTLEVIEQRALAGQARFPYVPGLFSFRELPPVIELLATLEQRPDLIICDGQGIAHPRRLGLASHLGVLFDVPTIGCGKTRFIGEHLPPPNQRGGIAALMDGDEQIGAALRTQDGTNPVYVSIGHNVTLETACKWVLAASPRFRLPETTRCADQHGRQFARQLSAPSSTPV